MFHIRVELDSLERFAKIFDPTHGYIVGLDFVPQRKAYIFDLICDEKTKMDFEDADYKLETIYDPGRDPDPRQWVSKGNRYIDKLVLLRNSKGSPRCKNI